MDTVLFMDDTVSWQSEKDMQKLVSEFNTVCERRKLNVDNSKVIMIFEKKKEGGNSFCRFV